MIITIIFRLDVTYKYVVRDDYIVWTLAVISSKVSQGIVSGFPMV